MLVGLVGLVGPAEAVATGFGLELVALLAVFACPLRAAAPVAVEGAVQPYLHPLPALVASQFVAVLLVVVLAAFAVVLPVVAPIVAVLLAFEAALLAAVLASIVIATAVAARSVPVLLFAALAAFLAAQLTERLAAPAVLAALLAAGGLAPALLKVLFELPKAVAGFRKSFLIVSLVEIVCLEEVGDRLALERLAQVNSVR